MLSVRNNVFPNSAEHALHAILSRPARCSHVRLSEYIVRDVITLDEALLGPVSVAPADTTTVVALQQLTAELGHLRPLGDGAALIDRIAALHTLVCAASSAIAAETLAFATMQRKEQIAAGVKQRDLGRGIAEQLAFARSISPSAASRHLSFARDLQSRLPHTWDEWRAGRISEVQAKVAVTRTSHLSDADTSIVDAALAPRMSGWNTRACEQAFDHAAYAVDPHGSIDRARSAAKDRRVWTRPAPDCMTIVSALLPTTQGVAVWAALRSAGLALEGTGAADGRTLGQTMADLLVTRCTGQATATAVPMELNVTIPLESLLGVGAEPAWLENYGPVPARSIRQACGSADDRSDPRMWIRRLLTDPAGSVVQVDARRRLFPAAMRRHVVRRDRACRQPFCDAPIREIDHVTTYATGGSTSLDNAQGLCGRGNKLKDLPGWKTRRSKDGSTTVTTPTGHTYVREPQRAVGLPAVTRRE